MSDARDARDAARYRWIRERLLVRRASAHIDNIDVNVHLNYEYVHAGRQYIPREGFEAEIRVLDAAVDAAIKEGR